MIEPVAFTVNPSVNRPRNGVQNENKAGNRDKRDVRKPKTKEKRHCSHCNKDGDSYDQCFEIMGYLDWYRGKRKGVRKIATQVTNETPFDGEQTMMGTPSTGFNPDMIQALCSEMMKVFKGKMIMPSSSSNFAGPFE